jgi:hypothetical protein
VRCGAGMSCGCAYAAVICSSKIGSSRKEKEKPVCKPQTGFFNVTQGWLV